MWVAFCCSRVLAGIEYWGSEAPSFRRHSPNPQLLPDLSHSRPTRQLGPQGDAKGPGPPSPKRERPLHAGCHTQGDKGPAPPQPLN